MAKRLRIARTRRDGGAYAVRRNEALRSQGARELPRLSEAIRRTTPRHFVERDVNSGCSQMLLDTLRGAFDQPTSVASAVDDARVLIHVHTGADEHHTSG